jgi:hypothetical protein
LAVTKPVRIDAGLSSGAGSAAWLGPSGVGGVYYQTGVGLVARRHDNIEYALNSATTLYVNTTVVSSVTTGEIDAHVYTMPANTLTVDGQRLHVIYAGNHAATANSATYRIYVAGTLLIGQVRATSGETEMVTLTITRASSTTFRSQSLICNGVSSSQVSTALFTATFTAPIIIKSTVDGPTASGDVVARVLRVEFWP